MWVCGGGSLLWWLACCGWLLGCVGVVCELDSVFVCFLCLFFVFECFWLGLLAGLVCLVGWFFWALTFLFLFGEFDPGSGRTLAACLIHASRAKFFWCLH